MAKKTGMGESARLSDRPEVFELEPAGTAALITLVGIALFCDVLAVVMVVTGSLFSVGTVIGLVLVLAVSALFFWLAFAQRSSRIVIAAGKLNLQVPLYGRRIPLSRINGAQVRAIKDLSVSPYQLGWRLNGLGAPGLQLGWFSSHGKGRMLAAVTTTGVLLIPTHDNYSLLVSVKRPDQLVSRLRQLP